MSIDTSIIPDQILGGIDRYINQRIQPGTFITAVLSNDLFTAMASGDEECQAALPTIVKYIFSKAPIISYGSADKVHDWLTRKDIS